METSTATSQTVETVRRLAEHAATVALGRMQNRYEQFREYPYHDRIHEAQDSFVGFLPILKRIVYYLFVGTTLFVTSMATYGLFYLAVMPSHAASEHLYFDYTCSSNVKLTCSNGTVCDSSCSPVATVDIFARHTPWEALHPDVTPDARSKSRILKPRKPYFLEVVLQLPESIVNQNAGMFGVKVELQSKDQTPLARSRRSARIAHESNWIGIVRKTICIVPLLLGAMTESRSVIVPSFRHYVESAKHPLRHIVVSLVSQGDEWTADTPVEVIAGQVRIGKELNALQSLLKEWFWTCFIVGTSVILSIQCIMFFVIHMLWESWRLRQPSEALQEEADLGDAPFYFNETDPQFAASGPFAEDDDEDEWEPTEAETTEPGQHQPDLATETPTTDDPTAGEAHDSQS